MEPLDMIGSQNLEYPQIDLGTSKQKIKAGAVMGDQVW